MRRRADQHTLFDIDRIGIDPDTLTVALAPAVREPADADLQGLPIRRPADPADGPDRVAPACRWQRSAEGHEKDEHRSG